MKKLFNIKSGFIFLLLISAFSFTCFLSSLSITVKADNENPTFTSSTYKTAGASVRLWENSGSALEDGKPGIRFHVLMDADLYALNKGNPNFKTYTVILPDYLLSGELTLTTKNALVLETTDVWKPYGKDPSFFESVAYVYGLPVTQYATEIAFRGVVSFDGGQTVSYQTEQSTRSMAFVAKSARDDSTEILSDPDKELARVSTLNKYIPKYNFIYKIGDSTTSEASEYGNAPAGAPQGVSIWKNDNGETVDFSKKITLNNKDSSVQDLVFTAYAKVTVTTTNSTASVNGTNIESGDSIELKCGTHSISASPFTDHSISSLNVNGSNKGAINDYTFTVTGDTSISIIASIITYTVSLDNVGGASVSGTVNGTFNINSTCKFTLGKGFYSVTVNGTEIFPSSNSEYSFGVTENSVIKIVKLTDAQTKTKILNIIANTPGTNLSVSGQNLVSPKDTSTITIPQAVFDELKKYGYTTLTFDIYKPQKKEILYKKRIQNITDGTTVAEVGINKDSVSGSVSLTKATSLEGQYKSFGSWSAESIGVSWTLSNINFY